jgi:putative sterol carrier protein
MGFKLGTQELADECMRRQDIDPSFQEKLKGLHLKLLFLGLDCPGNEDRQLAIELEHGRFASIVVSNEPAPSDLRSAPFDSSRYDFRVQAPQKTLVDLINGRVDLITAIQLVKIEGDIGKLMAQAAGFIGFIDLLSAMDIEQ